MSNLGEIPLLPHIYLPDTQTLPRPTLSIPTADIPSYKPLVIPPSNLKAPDGVEKEEVKTEKTEPPSVKIPVINLDMPLPTTEVVMAATYAAVSAVAVTTFAQPFFEQIKKKVQKQLQAQVNKWKENQKKNHMTKS